MKISKEHVHVSISSLASALTIVASYLSVNTQSLYLSLIANGIAIIVMLSSNVLVMLLKRDNEQLSNQLQTPAPQISAREYNEPISETPSVTVHATPRFRWYRYEPQNGIFEIEQVI